MEINEVTLKGFKVIGIETRTNNKLESDPSTSRIAKLWNKYFTEKVETKIPNKNNETKFMGVYTDYESDVNGEYSLIVCKEVKNLDTIPESFTGRNIEKAKYLKFTHNGEMPGIVFEAWKYIWEYFSESDKYERAYSSDFELYDITNQTKVEIFISIK